MHKKGDIALVVLGLIAVAGVLVALAVAPGLGAILKIIDPNPRKAVYKLERALRSLVSNGKVSHTKAGYRLTTEGEIELARRKFERYQFSDLKKWDRKWRVICFDIPEKRRSVRHIVHQKLVELGFCRLQDSVYVIPHQCGEILKLIQQALFLQKHVRGMVVTQIDDERTLLSHFVLKR